ncbi:hypothetical protein PRZ48_000549 [Zasmidium cellare]|uniref:Protein kinase domain-containing protein n=1 Tax=Zasmidium cellare TaxID=395010 RepID=A0ABR0F083_ZASCE|nr:hypothetical protein PRZ48_000549 [Zasmidium cellare]
MDTASRFHLRGQAQPYLDRERNGVPDDSGNECELAREYHDVQSTDNRAAESLIRRKFQRTNTDATNHDDTFRKPSIPASASRPQPDQRSGFSHHRRRSTLRENARVPSGPREFPSPGKSRTASGSIGSIAPAVTESTNTNTSRSFLPQSSSEPFFPKAGEAPRFSFGNPSSNDDTDSPTTPAERLGDEFDFIPTVNFDDLQNSIANYDGNGPLLSDFPAVGGGRVVPKETGSNRVKDTTSRPPVPKLEAREEPSVSRSASLRRRLSSVTGGKQTTTQNTKDNVAKDNGNGPQSGLSLRTRRQSTAPQGPPPAGPAPPPVGAGSRAPRKSLGPGVIASMMEGRKTSHPLPNAPDLAPKSSIGRTNSLTKSSRRTTMQPSTSGGAELPRTSTVTATTQSRANKVKSLQPPPREPDPNTPNSRPMSKGNPNETNTPSSSGNRRQSTVSGRASGLGARTISPTDARRLKRLSMMQAPPLPSTVSKGSSGQQQEEMPPMKLEMPRFAQPSPSLIPRRTSNTTPTSARASPEGRVGNNGGGGVSLSTKSSYQSLLASSASTSRLPTPKPRNVNSSSGQYGEDEEIVPPVPAIPKAYESPRESELQQQYFSGPLKSSQSGYGGEEFEADSQLSNKPPKANQEVPNDSRRKTSVDRPRAHQRMNTIENIERNLNMTAPKPARPQVDANGRKNNNLQPLRLPPLNLMPISQHNSNRASGFPRPSQEVETRDDYASAQTPEPKRATKTPSTPMTASKATFFRRQDDEYAKQMSLRSASSHYALRDLMQLDDHTTKFFDDSDVELLGTGVPVPPPKQRSAITPFASGSLPKASGEFGRPRGRPSIDNNDYTMSNFETFQQLQNVKPQGPRSSRSGTTTSYKTAETPNSLESPVESSQPDGKKEGGLRRKLSLGWRRSSSKANNHPDNKSSPQEPSTSEKEKHAKLQKRASEMPPPRLPASATWTGDVPTIPSTTSRPSLDSSRRKSTAASINTLSSAHVQNEQEPPTPISKTKSLHSEQPQPVQPSNRASSWGNIGANTRPVNPKGPAQAPKGRQGSAASTFSAIVKDKEDYAADEEMRRLSQKRKDVDTAAKETEELKKRAVARSPMSPERVLHDRNCTLNIFERGEVMDYEKDGVYFTGNKNARKIIGSLSPSPSGDKDSKAGNYGYDDERGDYNIILGDHLAYRYEVVDILGKGSFGQVVRCVDHKDGGIVAVKIIRNKKRFHQQALVEVGILGRLRDWDPDGAHATLSITSSFYFRSHLCIVTPCLSINLYELIRAHNFVGFSLPLIRRFARQLLTCLVLLQNKRIIHCDLKPENILLCEARKADVRVIDFGSSCKEEEKVYTYIQSRFYRSPEVILGSSYGLGIDMWSLGCILAELWTGYPLFPGENEQEQLACIMEIFGPPDRHLVERCTRKKLFFDSVGKPRVTVSSKGRRRRPSSKTLSQALKTEDEAFLDFITRCLRWDPDRRLKPQDAMSHPFIQNQPLNQRPGIPDEARRAARLRSTAAASAANNGIPSPVKRVHTTGGVATNSSNAFSQQQAQTPAKERSRPLPETPQTALRNGAPSNSHANQGSPSKQQVGGNRRQSVATGNSAAAVAGSKRASNGVPVVGSSAISGPGSQRQASGNNTGGSLAQMAAREANAARWRP